ncbi:hypothetical protein HYW75_02220 [Candidatus Pacearchaeota archaeon]|nr:hypothetical protein [Candidatus Pacearchaeota archaeon]
MSKSEESLNKIKKLYNKMVEFIKENQFRITLIIVTLVIIMSLIYGLFTFNKGVGLKDFFVNPLNLMVLFVIATLLYSVLPIVADVGRQTHIRDDVEQQTAIKLELGNIKSLRELKFKLREYHMFPYVDKLMWKDKKSKTTHSNQSKPSIKSQRKFKSR